MLRKWGALVLVVLALPAMGYAQNTGKLAGRVIDGSTGESLPAQPLSLPVPSRYGFRHRRQLFYYRCSR